MSLTRRVYRERRAVVLPLLLFLAANVAVLVLGVWPLRQSVARSQEAASEARNNLAASMAQQRQARTARTSTDNAGVELGTFYQDVLPANVREADSLMYWLNKTARSAGVQLRAGVSDYDEVQESRLMKFVNQAVLLGQYDDVLEFLHLVEVAPEFVIIEKVELAQTTGGPQSPNGVLELNLTVATYFVGDPPAAGIASPGGSD